jgi:hypothetical protein
VSGLAKVKPNVNDFLITNENGNLAAVTHQRVSELKTIYGWRLENDSSYCSYIATTTSVGEGDRNSATLPPSLVSFTGWHIVYASRGSFVATDMGVQCELFSYSCYRA